MCGIIGIFGSKNATEQAKKGLAILKNRGIDGSEVYEWPCSGQKKKEEKNAVGHCLHSVVGFVKQPIISYDGSCSNCNKKNKWAKNREADSVFAANCEIYNWEELNRRFNLNAKNDAELILKLIEAENIGSGPKKMDGLLEYLDGVYAFAYWNRGSIGKDDGKSRKDGGGTGYEKGKNSRKDESIILARDVLGVKPLWFSRTPNFAFASEKKALEQLGYKEIEELNPRAILKYNIDGKDNTNNGANKKIELTRRNFFDIAPEHDKPLQKIREELMGLFIGAVEKRLPDRKIRFGILFSGGIDSTLIAYVCKNMLKRDFVCYTAAVDEKETGMSEAEDVIYAKKAAKELGLKLKIMKIKISDCESYIKRIVPLIEDTNVVKVGVAMPFFVACEEAKKDNVKVIFSGLGSEELFAGYERHKKSMNIGSDINKECVSGLLKMYERDLYRDDTITMANSIELRLPFLDKELIRYSLKIPAKYKLDSENNKIIIRQAAEKLGVPKEFAWRKKKAAQYGSKFDKAIEKLMEKNKCSSKSEYLMKFYSQPNLKLGVLFSSGKDSAYAMHIMQRQNYKISCLISLKSKNPSSYMFHTPNVNLAEMQAEAMNIPLIVQQTKGEKEKELDDLQNALIRAKKKYNIDGIVTGALFSNYQRERIERICDSLHLKIFSPLWHTGQETEMRQLLNEGFEIVLSSIAAEGLDKSWLGRRITQKDVDRLAELNKKIGLNIAGEGGEFESLVLDAPMFKKRIEIVDSAVKMENENTGFFAVKKARLVGK